MKFLEKLTSKKGQVSMEIGILVAAAVAVAAIAAYFYAKNVKNSASNTEATTNSTISAFNKTADAAAQNMTNLMN
ncbi:class III signal peptide-containing protein [Methanococcus maripaludis]|uniref:Class III signal peptide-containing protein n=1 Tax=Methanococcus maripaludis TaxID=39152 RepID=A0A8T3VZB5_METMI|nr:class III signal peptide-containing protein [Methanococcus maripaludis]MBG0769281.1 class III signal peptide-containing protein [Methanococcus maripaludis]